MNVKLFCTSILLFLCAKSVAQNLTGKITDEKKAPLENVNVILYSIKDNSIVSYTTSGKAGTFNLQYTIGMDSLRLEASSLGFEKQAIIISGKTPSFLTIALKVAVNNLQEVIVKENVKAISTRKDTINYNVKAFSDSSDRVIIDIIKKLPGIKVTSSGQILYNNKAINKFYIEGKDLLENRYNIASNNLPSHDVEQVQIIPNHQPIKLLDGKQFSDRAAINIKLKKEAKLRLLGIGDIGVGLPHFLRDDDLALLKFSKKIQFINTIKSDNIGNNLDQELNDQNLSSNFYDSKSSRQDILSLVHPDYPPLDQNRFKFNNNNVVTNNYLLSISKVFDLKINAAFENDAVLENPSSITTIYLPRDTITIKEDQAIKKTYQKLLTGFALEANTNKVYLKNTIKLQRIWSNETDAIAPSGISQSLNNPFTNIINDLNAILKVSDNTIGINSYTAYNNVPQQLNVTPGLYSDSLNSNQPYNELLQKVQLKNFYSNNAVSYGIKKGLFSLSNTIGFTGESQTFSNGLYKEQSTLTVPVGTNYQNSIERTKFKLYDNLGIAFNQGAFNISLSIKNNFNRLSNKGKEENQELNKFFVNPELSIRYKINNYLETAVIASTSNTFSNDANKSYILIDYRDLVSNGGPINESFNKNASYELVYNNIVRGLFANFNIFYSYRTSNVLTYYQYAGILAVRNFILEKNPSTNLNAAFNISKYYDDIKTTINTNLTYTANESEDFQQGVLNHLRNESYLLNTSINSTISDKVALAHSFNLSIFKNSAMQDRIKIDYNPILTMRQDLAIKIFLPKKILSKFNFEQYYSNITNVSHINNFFTDISLQKSLQNTKADFSIIVTNIFGAGRYSSYMYNNNILVSSTYPLRNRMLMLKVSFQF
ncbi:MAG: TonB-dependent receptor [Mucilaginibacter sp.]